MITVRVEGGDKLARALRDLPTRVDRSVQRDALKAGGELIRARAAALAPRAPGAPDIADHITMSGTRPADGSVGLAVGPAKGFYYGRFLEFGTSRQGAQPFLRPALDGEGAQAIQRIIAELWAALIRRGSGSGRSSGGGVGL